MSSNLLILGAGQYGALVYELAESLGCYDKISFLDDCLSEGVVGGFVDAKKLLEEYSCAIVAIGNSDLRLKLLNQLEEMGYEIPVLIHSTAYVSPSAVIAKGSIIEPLALVQTGVTIGKGCLISSGAVVNHNAIVCDGCHIDCNATVPARATVPYNTKITR